MISTVKVYAIEQLNQRGSITGYLKMEGGVTSWPPPRGFLRDLWLSTNRGYAERVCKSLTLDPKRPMRVVVMDTLVSFDS